MPDGNAHGVASSQKQRLYVLKVAFADEWQALVDDSD